MIIGFKFYRNFFFFKIERYFKGSGCKNEFRQQVLGLGIFPYRYLAVLKISRKSGADSCSTPLVSLFENFPGDRA